MKKCYYEILGVSAGAGEDEIKKAFRLMVLRWHPDRNPSGNGSSERLMEVIDAYKTLSDPLKRQEYDVTRGYRGNNRHTFTYEGMDWSSDCCRKVFEEIFGSRPKVEREIRGRDLRFDLQILGNTAREGTYERISYERMVACSACTGRTGNGARSTGCRACQGTGEVSEMCVVSVWIPPGSSNGQRLRVSGGGDQTSRGGAAGDLVVVLHVIDNGVWRRNRSGMWGM